jgi:hypothetical protein
MPIAPTAFVPLSVAARKPFASEGKVAAHINPARLENVNDVAISWGVERIRRG